MKKITLFLISLLSLVFFVNPVYAHILKSDGSIGAVVHIDPDDDPVIGELATFYLDFKDKKNRFDLAQCQCEVTVLKNEKEIYKEQLTIPTFSYTFPEKAIYEIVIRGEPLESGAFDTFTLHYDLRVDRVPGTKSNNDIKPNYIIHAVAIGSIVFVFFGILFYDRIKQKDYKQ